MYGKRRMMNERRVNSLGVYRDMSFPSDGTCDLLISPNPAVDQTIAIPYIATLESYMTELFMIS